jgi:hypothetical protein
LCFWGQGAGNANLSDWFLERRTPGERPARRPGATPRGCAEQRSGPWRAGLCAFFRCQTGNKRL